MKHEKLADGIGKPKYVKSIKSIALKPQYIPINLYPSVYKRTEQLVTNDIIRKEK